MNFGCDYYPEHWPEERWTKDIQMMAEAGFNVVRLAEFAWSKLEPEEGQYDFDWLDRAIKILAENRIRIILGTPTATPPAWLARQYPTIFRVDEKGIRSSFGGRRGYCPNSSIYRDYSQRIVLELAKHYKNNENVIGWQIDNEFGGLCYCESCLKEFRKWLKEKYSTLEQLNKEWGTIFWSQTYTDWDEIPLPRQLDTAHNPSLLLDYRRFISDSYISYQKLQIDILRKSYPHKFITHNFMGLFNGIDYYKLAEPLDFVAWDNYPNLKSMEENKSLANENIVKVSLSHDLMRGLKRQNFWVMEEESGPPGWEYVESTPPPGQIRLWTYQAIAHGADGILYFRWRTSRFGTEQFWHGILDQAGVTTRRYEEIRKVGQELQSVGSKLIGLEFPQEVAILTSYDEQWAFGIQPNNPQFNYQEHFASYYRILNRWNIPVDVVSIRADLSKYKLVIAPALFLINDELVENLKEFVKKGGTLIITFRSGVKNWNNVVLEEPLPGKLNDLLGIEVIEYDSLPSQQKCKLKLIYPEIEPLSGECNVWCDIIKCGGAEVIGRYAQSYYKGEACVTINRFGQGCAIYIGTNPSPEIKATILKWATEKSGVRSSFPADSKDLEVVLRRKEGKNCLFFLNHSGEDNHVKLDSAYVELLENRKYAKGSIMTIEPKGVKILWET